MLLYYIIASLFLFLTVFPIIKFDIVVYIGRIQNDLPLALTIYLTGVYWILPGAKSLVFEIYQQNQRLKFLSL